MKISNKIWLVVLLAIASVFALLPAHKVLAFTDTPVTASSLALHFVDRSTITGTVNGVPVTYVDSDPTDTTYQYVINTDGIFCDPGTKSNITILNNDIALDGGGSSTVEARFDATVSQDPTEQGCTDQKGTSVPFDVGNPQAGMNHLQWQSDGNLQITGGASLTEIGTTDVYQADPNKSCGGGTVAVVNGSGATIYSLQSTPARPSPTANPIPASDFPDLANTSLANGCSVNNINESKNGVNNSTQNYSDLAKQTFGIAGSRPSAGTGAVGAAGQSCDQSQTPPAGFTCSCPYEGTSQVCTLVGSSSTDQAGSDNGSGSVDTCTSNSSGIAEGLAWIFCPLINTIGNAAEKMNDLIESQLRFNVAGFLPDNEGIYQTWNVIRYIVSSMLVIILLVMILSQAVSWGPFDAYTVKKVLPRLVIAVILMQLSWYIGKYLITLSNDAGDSIKQILLAPFPTAGDMKLGNLIGHLGGPWAGLTGLTLTGAFLAAPFLAFFFLPGVLFTVFGVLITIITALATIMFRNILIIVFIIFAPVALLVWIIPSQGMKRYFKLWSDNLTKILLLYPLMIGLIYGGRIFAWIGGGLGAAGPIDFIMVLVGFFLPYALLPKAFKWGGSAMAAGSRAINDSGALKATRAGGRKFLKEDFGKYWQGKLARDMYSSTDKLFRPGMKRVGGVPLIPTVGGRIAGRLASKHWMPTAHGRAQTLREGATYAEERREDARKYNRRLFEQALTDGYAVDKDGKRFLPGKDQRPDKDNYLVDKYGKRRKLFTYDYTDPTTGVTETKKAFAGPGTGAAKQALVDNVALDNAGNERVAKDAVEQLILTSSNPEIENSFISFGNMKGKRVFEADSSHDSLGAWEREVGGSQQLYPEEAKANYDLQVHLIRSAYGPADDPGPKILGRTMLDRLNDLGNTAASTDLKKRYFTDKKRTKMSAAHQSLYNLGYDMGPENFATQSLGFWQRQFRNANEAETLYGDKVIKSDVGTALAERMADLAKLGDAGAQMMRPLVGGEKGKVVDDILALSNDPRFIKDYAPVEIVAAGGTRTKTWQPVHKTMSDFAREAHEPNLAPAGPITPPAEPPTDDDVRSRRSYRAKTEPLPPVSGGGHPDDEYPAYRRPGGGIESAIPAATAATAAPSGAPGAVGTTGPPLAVRGMVPGGEFTVQLHPESLQAIESAVARGVSSAQSGRPPVPPQAQDNPEQLMQLRRIYTELKRQSSESLTPEQKRRLEDIEGAHPDWG